MSAVLVLAHKRNPGCVRSKTGSRRGPGQAAMLQPLEGQCQPHGGCFVLAQLGQALHKGLLGGSISPTIPQNPSTVQSEQSLLPSPDVEEMT